ncbi:hypothetical protein FPV67DRAFT_675892 [Lyophyllum atratum]|nr:hypothetical protein FPV67DRAFT_675892 [Lyophyllum atratum]
MYRISFVSGSIVVGKSESVTLAPHRIQDCKLVSACGALADCARASVISGLCSSNEHVILALTRASIPAITRVYRVQLRHSESIFDPNEFQLLHTLVSPVPQIARTIEPALQLLILSSANTVDVMTINGLDGSSPRDTNGKTIDALLSISTQSDDLDELLNGIVGARIMGPYVVLFKSRSIELYPLVARQSQARTTSNSHQLQVLKHQFSTLTFRSLSCLTVL